MTPNTAKMVATLEGGLGLIHAEALSFALAAQMQRPQAQAVTKALCKQAQQEGGELRDIALAAYPDLPAELFDPAQSLGLAPDEARAFALRAKAL